MATKKKRTAEDVPATKIKRVKIEKDENESQNWKDYELVAVKEQIDVDLAKTLIDLLDNENTIPFLCRYRKNLIKSTNPDKLRNIEVTLKSVRDLQTKISNFLKTLDKKQVQDDVKEDVKAVRSFEELEFYKSLYKSEGKRTLYEKAVELGLSNLANDILEGKNRIIYENYINPKTDGIKSTDEVQKGAKDILIHLIVKNKLIIEEIRELKDKYTIRLESKNTKAAKDDKNSYKFETYFDFSCPCSNLKPHQILALYRGENLKLLKLTFTFDNRFSQNLSSFAKNILLKKGNSYDERSKVFDDAFREAFTKRISPFVIRQVRIELQKSADIAAIASFADNLKNLLLMVPVKGKKILGIDPGFTHGCKMALICENGNILETATIYPHSSGKKIDESEKALVDLIKKHKCKLIGLGNGTACRETEVFLDKIINKFKLDDVEYCIVSEQGASIYSCSDVAKKEFPKMDTNVISAISIARRLANPLSELVKIEPKHLGVGMYQHDVDDKNLNSTLDSVVSECVSYVGVDINCASVSLLKHIAGLTEKRALSILEHKQKHGTFKSREELMKVKLIGPKTYTQMIGFIKIDKATAGCEKINLLDTTTIHPESYELTKKILKECGLDMKDFGTKTFAQRIIKYSNDKSIDAISKSFKEQSENIENVLNTLKNESPHHDYRSETNFQPDFKRGIQKLSDLKANQIVKGVVRNIVDFGAFIDIGVQQDGLLHKSKYKTALKLGDKIECKIISISENGKRISLDLVK